MKSTSQVWYKSSRKIMLKSNFEFEVLVHGSPAKEYYHKGNYYIEGKEGSKFSLRMKNNSCVKALFVPTIDGLSIMNGEKASYKSRGYVINAYDSLTVDGWRTSDEKVAEFFFSSPRESYAKKIEKDGNLGVIGCAVFREKIAVETITVKEYIPYPVYQPCSHCHCNCHKNGWWGGICYSCSCSSGTFTITGASGTGTYTGNAYLCQSNSDYSGGIANSSVTTASSLQNISASSTTSDNLGTGFGQDKYSPVTTIDFDKESSPTEVFSIFYNTKQNLEALGIEFRKPIYVAPSAFPDEDSYCKRPV